jgi:hypothetical protein
LAPQSKNWDFGVLIAAITSLCEGRPGIVEFWEDYRDGIVGWPSILATAISQLTETSSGKDPVRRAELALYVAFAYCEHLSERRVYLPELLTKREPFAPYRVKALQATFVGLIRNSYRMPRTRALRPNQSKHKVIDVTRSDGVRTSVAMTAQLYEVACRAIGEAGVKDVARAITKTFDADKEDLKLAAVVRNELRAIVRDNLEAVQFLGAKAAKQVAATTEYPKRGMNLTCAEKRARYGSGYRKSWLAVRVGGTTVAINPTLYQKAVHLLGSESQVNAVLRKSVRDCKMNDELSRSELAREGLMHALCRHPQVEQIRLN